MPVIIRNWSVVYRGDCYQAPEIRPRGLSGTVFNHPKKSDGTEVLTSEIVAVNGRSVFTRTGTEYYLESPDPDYVQEIRALGYTLDPENPIRVKRAGV